MSDFFVQKSCGECARYINFERCPCPMDECVSCGYSKFLDPHEQPSKFCEKCQRRLKRVKTDKYSNEYREISLECPKHGVVGQISEQFKRLKVQGKYK